MAQYGGLDIVHNGHQTRLKWHRLRRSMTDPEFGAAVMAEGFRLGASMELDLQVRADGGFVVMHDETLERETLGHGRVADMTGAELAEMRYSAQDCPLILSEDLARMLPVAHPRALLQFDMKNDLAEVGPRGVAHLADLFSRQSHAIIVSGGSLPLIRALGDRMPDLKRGIDPTDRLLETWQADGLAVAEALLRADLRGGTDPDMVYLQWEMVVEAARQGLDMVALAQAEGVQVDAWTHCLKSPATGFAEAEGREFAALMALKPDQITTDEAVATEAAWLALQERT